MKKKSTVSYTSYTKITYNFNMFRGKLNQMTNHTNDLITSWAVQTES